MKKEINMTLAVSHCPDCYKKLKAKDSRPHTAYGFPTVKRRRVCPSCDFRITTIEVPLDVGNSLFKEE
jgi:transcriptional regulator NrdR family protein|tara:strand:- start:105 stop:308 length:204 start_codon:yes stop_codon:yes gene_type:complete